LGQTLPVTLAFDFPNVASLVDHLLGGIVEPSAPKPAYEGSVEDLLSLMEHATDDEVGAIVARRVHARSNGAGE
jgi:hypothetical protein